jgi:IrrE N-terminal-like domain
MLARSAGAEVFADNLRADTPATAMRIACAQLLRACGVERPPVPLKKLLNYLKVQIDVVSAQLEVDAELRVKKGQFSITISERSLKQNWQRARFTIAHEFGHILLAHHLGDAALYASLDETTKAHRENEHLCDIAAKELLMPTSMVRSALYENGLSPKGIDRIMCGFAVSQSAIMRSITDAIPGTSLFVWRKYARHAREENTYRVVSNSKYHPGKANPWLPAGCTATHVSPRIISKAAEQNKAIFQDDLELALPPKKWRGQGAITFFPNSVVKQASLADVNNSKVGKSQRLPQTMYLFFSEKDVDLAQYFNGRHAF